MLNEVLNIIKLNKNKAALVLIIPALLITPGCGKRKAPLPPVGKVSPRVEINGSQQGDIVFLYWNLPKQKIEDRKSFDVTRTDIYRLLEPASSSLILTEEEFSSRSTLIATVPVSEIGLKQQTYADKLEFVGQPARLRYAVRFVNSAGQKAAFSNFLLIEPTAKIADVPQNLILKSEKDFISLSWTAPANNIDGSKPANIIGYNIYRAAGRSDFIILNKLPAAGSEFLDKTFRFGDEYKYFVRTVSLGAEGQPIESLNSVSAVVTAKDIFPPDAPTALTIAAAPKNISIFFTFNSEKDVVGYKIFRTSNQNLPKSEWLPLTPQSIVTNTFQDSAVESGKTYFYFVVAVDEFGNISEPSEVVSETAP